MTRLLLAVPLRFVPLAMLVGVLLGLVAGAFLVLSASRSDAHAVDPQIAMQSFADAIVQEHYAAATAFIQAEAGPHHMAHDMLPLLRADLVEHFGPLTGAVAQEAVLHGSDAGEVVVVWHFEHEQIISHWQLVRSNGVWQINNFQLNYPSGTLG